MLADRVLITAGTSEAIDLVLSALVDSDGEVLVPMPTYPLYTALLAKIDARARYYRADPARGWLPDLDHLESLVTTATRALVVIDPNNPTGATYPTSTRRALLDFADRHGLVMLADEVYGDLGYDGPIDPIGKLDPDAADHLVLEPVEGVSRAGMANRLDGRSAARRGSTASLAAIRKMSDARLCSNVPMQYAVAEALLGDRSHQPVFRAALRTRATLTARRLSAMPGMTCDLPTAGFYAMPKLELPPGRTDEDYVLGLLRATGVLCVYGSGFGMPADGRLLPRSCFSPRPRSSTRSTD